MNDRGEITGKPGKRDVTESEARRIADAISKDPGNVELYDERMRRSTDVPQETLDRKYAQKVGDPVTATFTLTDEERAWLLAEIKEARRTQPAYAARMRAFGRHTEVTMQRRFGVKHP